MRVTSLGDEEQVQSLLLRYWPTVAVVVVALVALWLATPRLVRPLVRHALKDTADGLQDSPANAIELAKRRATLESLAVKSVRSTLAAFVGLVVVGLLGLWWLLAALGLLLAAVMVAGQPIVLDCLMGLSIFTEGTFFKGDNITVSDPQFNLHGTVESVGLRHTVIRAPDGTVHSISNRLMTHVSNRTRAFAGADVTIRGIREEDFAHVLQIMDRVGSEIADDPDFTEVVISPLEVAYVDDPDDLGWSAVMRGKVVAGERWAVGTEVRKRVVKALLDDGIELNRRGLDMAVGGPDRRSAPIRAPEPGGEAQG